MTLRMETIGAAGSAVTSAVGAILDLPAILAIAAVMAALSAASYLSRKNNQAGGISGGLGEQDTLTISHQTEMPEPPKAVAVR